jgi:Fic family protein
MSKETSFNEWQPVTDLPDNWPDLSIPDLASLARVWTEQHDRLKQSQAVHKFNERLKREWSIETGILERLYTIDRGITQLLIEQGLDATLIPHGATDRPISEIISILQDHRHALEGLFAFVANRQLLTTSYIRQLHQVMTRHQQYVDALDQFGNSVKRELLRGFCAKWPNNPTRPDGLIHEYCPPLQVAVEIERLLAFYDSHKKVSPEVLAAWLHHRFTQIHPCKVRNGRVARALATIVFLRASWFPLVINRDQKEDYIAALEIADEGDLAPLVKLFGKNAKRAFVRALSLSEDVLRGERALSRVVDSLVDVYQTRQRLTEETYQQVDILADHLINEARNVLDEVTAQIEQKFAVVPSPPLVRVTVSLEHNKHYYTAQIISVAQELGYWANIARRRNWVRLYLVNGQKTHLIFSFHYLGKVNRGVMVCTSFVYFPESKPQALPTDDEAESESQFGETYRSCSEPFYFSYQDETRLDGLKADFRKWMSEAITIGLAEWVQRV